MEFNLPRPEKTLSLLNEFQKTKQILNVFDEEEKLVNFLKNNSTRYKLKGKIEVILHNFEKNTLFLYRDKNKIELFKFLNRSEIIYDVSESILYKMYFYFSGVIETEELKRLLIKYSGNTIKRLNFKEFIKNNSSRLFTEYSFPKDLNGDYYILNEVAELIEEKPEILKNLEYWQENILKYLINKDLDKETLKKIYKVVLKSYSKEIEVFFNKNKKVAIKNIIIEFQELNNRNFKLIKLNLEKNDILILGENVILKNINSNMMKKERYFWYFKKEKNILENLKLKNSNKFDIFAILEHLKYNYSLNKLYFIKIKLKRLFSKEK